MPSYRIHRLKSHLRQQFRSAPHLSGTAQIKPRDYEPPAEQEGSIEAATPYAAFFALREAGTPLEVGDLLEDGMGALRICKFVGFEEARWIVPEAVPNSALPALPAAQPAALE